MKTEAVTVARIYVREHENLLNKLITFLRDECDIAGLTVLRGVEGFSGNGPVHEAFLLDLSLDLPLIIEFYDVPERVDAVLRSLVRRFPLPHVISWQANRVAATK